MPALRRPSPGGHTLSGSVASCQHYSSKGSTYEYNIHSISPSDRTCGYSTSQSDRALMGLLCRSRVSSLSCCPSDSPSSSMCLSLPQHTYAFLPAPAPLFHFLNVMGGWVFLSSISFFSCSFIDVDGQGHPALPAWGVEVSSYVEKTFGLVLAVYVSVLAATSRVLMIARSSWYACMVIKSTSG